VKASTKIFSERLSIIGKTDILEFHESGEIIPVELKRGKTRKSTMHEIQLALMALCLRERGCFTYCSHENRFAHHEWLKEAKRQHSCKSIAL